MAKINLAQALKEKNRLVSRINELKIKVQKENNRFPARTPEPQNCHTNYAEITRLRAKLIDLKAKISKANVDIYAKLAGIEEAKDNISFLQQLNTNPSERNVPNPKFSPSIGNPEPQFFTVDAIVQIKLSDVELAIKESQTKIEALQDEVDVFNGTTKIEYEK
jgi:chromosome segregation ATPase